jgi:hypothetical protein
VTFIFQVEPYSDESLAGLIVRATARNFHRNTLVALRSVDVMTNEPGSLCSRSPALSRSIAKLVGSRNTDAIERMFQPPIEGRSGWINFFGEPMRAFYRAANKRRVAPRALRKGDYVRAMWGLRPLSFDPLTKEQLIDACPQCGRELGWTLTYGVAFCDHCSRPERFTRFTWHYPGLDLRDFPQPVVEVDDEETLDFVTGLIDPHPGRKEASRRLLPDIWSVLPNGDVFEVVMTFAGMLVAGDWDKRKAMIRRRSKSGEGWDKITPEVLSVAGRAIIGGQAGIEEFGDILRRESGDKPREKRYGKMSEIGPLGIVDPRLCETARQILQRASESYITSRKDPDMMPLLHLAGKYRVSRIGLSALAESRLIPTIAFDDLEKAPVLMSDKALAPLVLQAKNAVSDTIAAPTIGIHRVYLEELERRKLIVRVSGPALKLLTSDIYFTRESIESLGARLSKAATARVSPEAVRLRVALRALKVVDVPWAAILAAIVDGRLEVFSLKPKGPLGDRLATVDLKALADLIDQEAKSSPTLSPEWVGNAAAAEILGTNESAVWRLMQIGKLKRNQLAPVYAPFRRLDVERLAREIIFIPEIVQIGRFGTYRSASTWLTQQDLAALLELKRGGWKFYQRASVERALAQRVVRIDSRRPRPKGLLHGPESPEGKLASARESHDASRIGFATAAALLGCTIFATQKLAAIGKLERKGKVTPYGRVEVEALAKEIIFVPEIMRRAGVVTHRGAMRWLKREGMTPLLLLKGDRLPVFERAPLEMLLGKPIAIGKTHPREHKDKLLALVAGGSSVHAASKLLEIPYPTAKSWVRDSR